MKQIFQKKYSSRKSLLARYIAFFVGLMVIVTTVHQSPVYAVTQVTGSQSSLSTLDQLISISGLSSELSSGGPITLFAPTNSAFSSLPNNVVCALQRPSNQSVLASVLRGHVVSGSIDYLTLTDGQRLTTIAGTTLTADVDIEYEEVPIETEEVTEEIEYELVEVSRTVRLIDSQGRFSTLTTPSISAPNGRVYQSSSVILNQTFDFPPTLTELIQSTPTLTQFGGLINQSELLPTMSNPQQDYTIVAPDNIAWNSMPFNIFQGLQMTENRSALVNLLGYHVIPGLTQSSNIANGSRLVTFQGSGLVGLRSAGVSSLRDNLGVQSRLTTPDQEFCNGILHIADQVLYDQSEAYVFDNVSTEYNPQGEVRYPTALDFVQASSTFTSLASYIQAADLGPELREAAKSTTFLAPTNAAFQKLPQTVLDDLKKPKNKEVLKRILKYHIVLLPTIGELQDGQILPTLEGGSVTVVSNNTGDFIEDSEGNLSRISTPVKTASASELGITEGALYQVDAVLVPGPSVNGSQLEVTGVNILLVSILSAIILALSLYVFKKSEERV